MTVGTECFAALIETGLRAAPRHRIDAAHRRVEINGRDPPKEERIVELFVERLRELCRTTHIDIPFGHVVRYLVDMAIAGEDRSRRLRAPPRQTGESVGGITDHPEIVGDRLGRHTELRDHAVTVVDDLSAAIELNDPSVGGDTLGEILVGSADHDLLDAIIRCGLRRRCRHCVVGLVFDLGPDLESGEREQFFDLGELGEEFGVDPRAVLVSLVEIVSPRLDDMVGRDPKMRGAIGNQIEHGVEHPSLGSMPGIAVRFRVVEAEQLIGAVDEVNLHGPDSPTSTRGKMHGMTERVPLTDLPIEDCVDDVRSALAERGRCVVTAEPGAGKTTILPLRLLDEPWLDGRTIVLLEPRRMAARAAARRLARLLGEDAGETVGWITRDDRAVGPATRLVVVTEGVLTARLVDDPALTDVGLVIFDEFHERSVPGDVGLALMLAGAQRGEHDARLLLMSATIDADAIAAHLDDAPVVSSAGRTYPIELVWRPKKRREPLAPAVVRAVREALRGPGDVLVFLPGVGEIRTVERELTAVLGPDGPAVLPLHGSLPSAEQDAALVTRADRRVVLATNIAETSLTVDGITAVVDSGLERTARLDPRTGMRGLHTINCSRASADQRAGRAGRLGPGVAIRLWSKAEHAARAPHAPPAITEDDMTPVALDLARRAIIDPATLPFLTPPDTARWAKAVELLTTLGARDDTGAATDLGRRMAMLPAHPRLARLIVDARHPWLACVIAAVLDERDVLRGRPVDLPVELAERVRLVIDPDAHHGAADSRALRTVRDRARQLARRADVEPGLGPHDVDLTALGATLAPGFPDRIARRIGATRGGFVTADGQPLSIDRREAIHEAAGIVAVDIDARSKRGAVHRATALEAKLDHLVYATPDLAGTVDRIRDEWGVTPTPGGSHDGLGTANALLAIGNGAYLEIIGPDPSQPDHVGPRPFGVDDVTEPRLITWAAAVPDLDLWLAWCTARKLDPGPAFTMQRTTPAGDVLHWRLTLPPGDGDGVVPFLIEWPGATPATTAAPGVELVGFELSHPDLAVAGQLQEYALPYPVTRSAASLRAVLLTPASMVTLES